MTAPRFGRYHVVREIASGGMATVYLGRVQGEGGFERLVAIKVMHPHIAKEQELAAMFLDEARLAANIRHPNVVPIVDVQTSPEGLFQVMDYVDGPSLQQIRKHLRREHQTIPLPITLRIVIDLLHGLQAAHDATDGQGRPLQIIHRDVTPHNVLVGRDGVTKITDFGVAHAEARLATTRSGQLKGKIAYMPPEQLLGEAIDSRVDIYSAGVCLWESLVGRKMFSAPNEGALMHKVVYEPTPAASDHVAIPAPVEEVLQRALARAPADRFTHAIDFADALEEAARGAGVAPARGRDVSAFVHAIADAIAANPPGPSLTGNASADGSVPVTSYGSDTGEGAAPPRTPERGQEWDELEDDVPTTLMDDGAADAALAALADGERGPDQSGVTATNASFETRPADRSRFGTVVALTVAGTVGLGLAVILAVQGLEPSAAPTTAAAPSSPTPVASSPEAPSDDPAEPEAAPSATGASSASAAPPPSSAPPPAPPPPVRRPPPPVRPPPTKKKTKYRPTEL